MLKALKGMVSPVTGIPIERLGTTGSREGPVTKEQEDAARTLLEQFWPFKELHHGVATGWDEWFHFLVREMFGRHTYKSGQRTPGPQIHGWPPTNRKFLSERALADCDVVHGAREYKVRDREVVYVAQGLIGGPKDWAERLYGGTWYTMRQAVATCRPVWFVRRDGLVVPEWKSEMNEHVQTREAKERDSYEPTAALFRNAERPTYRAKELGIDTNFSLDEAFGTDPDPGDPLDEIFG